MTGATLPLIEYPYCVACGCTEFTPCETESGPCGWATPSHSHGGRAMCNALRGVFHHGAPVLISSNRFTTKILMRNRITPAKPMRKRR